jgi:hypothetical protein
MNLAPWVSASHSGMQMARPSLSLPRIARQPVAAARMRDRLAGELHGAGM